MDPSADETARRQAPLSMDAERFRALGHSLVDRIASLLESIPNGPITRDEAPSSVREALGLNAPLPEHGMDASTLLTSTAQQLFAHSLFNAHPRFYGYITSSPAPIGLLGDFLAAAVNPNVGAWTLSPAASEIEAQTVRWIAELINYPTTCGGLLVSGGNMANFVCFLAARAAGAGFDLRRDGVAASPRTLLVYASAETHTWIQKAADLAGLGTQSIRWIPTGNDSRMDVAKLDQQIAADLAVGHAPLMVIGTAGTVSTGAVDPLQDIARVCRDRGIWFHVDGAYGGFAAAVPNGPSDLRVLSLADSVAVDPHKWLYAPLEAGCALVRDPAMLRAAFSYSPAYYHFGEEGINFVDYGPQNSRGFRALKVWLALKQVGAAGYRQMIGDDITLSRLMADAVRRQPDLQLVTQALSIATFRFVPRDLARLVGDPRTEDYFNRLNEALLDALQRGGEAFVSNALVGGRYVLRACIVNFHATRADVEAIPEIAVRYGREIDARMREETAMPGESV